VFDAIRARFGTGDVSNPLLVVSRMNDLRNTRIAHQEKPLTEPEVARQALQEWVRGMSLMLATRTS